MPFYLAKLVFSGLHNFEENFFARYRMIRFKFRWQPPETLWLCSVAAKFIWSPRKLFTILMIPSYQQFISSRFYQKSLFYLQYSIDDNWSSLPFPRKPYDPPLSSEPLPPDEKWWLVPRSQSLPFTLTLNASSLVRLVPAVCFLITSVVKWSYLISALTEVQSFIRYEW